MRGGEKEQARRMSIRAKEGGEGERMKRKGTANKSEKEKESQDRDPRHCEKKIAHLS